MSDDSDEGDKFGGKLQGAVEVDRGYTQRRGSGTERCSAILGGSGPDRLVQRLLEGNTAHGAAWRYWDRANEMANRLGPQYRHVHTSFSTTVLTAHAVTLDVELRRPGDAVRIVHSFDPGRIPSLPRRSRHLIEVARAHHQRDDRAGTYGLLDAAERTAPETIRFNGYARDLLLSLTATPPSGLRDDVHALCTRAGVQL